MRYKILVEGYPMLGPAADGMHFTAIPGTSQELELDTNEGLGKTILDGYLKMLKAHPNPEIHDECVKFRKAIDYFCRFLAGEGRDNCNQVTKISEVTENNPLLPEAATAFLLSQVMSHDGDANSPLRYKSIK